MSRWWMAGGLALAVVSALALAVAIRRVIQTNRESVVASVPLAPGPNAGARAGRAVEIEVELDRAGPMVLYVEGPTGSAGFRGTRYQLSRRANGDPVALEATLFRTKVSGISRSRVSLYTFRAPEAGAYLLEVTGMAPDARADLHSIVFTRDTRARMLGWVLAIVAASLGLIGGTVIPLVLFLVGRAR